MLSFSADTSHKKYPALETNLEIVIIKWLFFELYWGHFGNEESFVNITQFSLHNLSTVTKKWIKIHLKINAVNGKFIAT